MQDLIQQASSANIAATTKSLFQKLQSIDAIKVAKKPKGLKATLRPYQEQGLSWLQFLDEIASGGVLADDMGLGKTIQTIALLLAIKQEKKAEPLRALIVAPTSVVTNWVREIERFGPSLTTALWHGAGRKEQMMQRCVGQHHPEIVVTRRHVGELNLGESKYDGPRRRSHQPLRVG